VVQDLALTPTVTCYRRERWETPDGETILADLDPGIIGGYSPNLHRLVLMLAYCHYETVWSPLGGVGGSRSVMLSAGRTAAARSVPLRASKRQTSVLLPQPATAERGL
jgi:hypothetical protein